MKLYLFTFGCKVNQYESQIILEKFLDDGFEKSNDFIRADVVLINSCTVTEESSKKAFSFIRKVKRTNPNAVIALVGCIAQAFPDLSRKFLEVDVILGNKNKFLVLDKVKDYLKHRKRIVEIFPYTNIDCCESLKIKNFEEHTRAFIKVQDGCNQFCSYCVIPYARGSKIRSKSLDCILKQVKELSYNGYKEIVVVGINLCLYGKDLGPGIDICNVVEKIGSIDGVERIRLGSLDSQFLNSYIIERLSNIEKLCGQFHLSLQSGCDKILKRMNRHYTTKEYETVVELLRKNFDNSSITTDIMVGFPGETELDFSDSLKFVEKIGFYRVHVFPYSERQGTAAEKLPKNEKISKEIKNLRCKTMIKIAKNVQMKFLGSQVGKTVSVLFEKEEKKGASNGHARNYVPVIVNSPSNLSGKILDVKVINAREGSCTGVLV